MKFILKNIITILIILSSFTIYSQNSKTDSLLVILENSEEKMPILFDLANEYYYLKNTQKAKEYINIILNNLDTTNVKKEVEIKNLLANCYHIEGNYEKALAILNDNLEKCNEKKLIKFKGDTYALISNTYWRQGKLKKSIEYNLKALKILELEKQSDNSYIYSNLAIAYTDMGEYKKADSIYNIAIKLFNESDKKHNIGKFYENKGIIKFYENKYDEALTFYKKALEVYILRNDTLSMGVCTGNIAEVYEMLGNNEKALRFYMKALSIENKLQYKSGIIFLYYGIARTYKKKKQWNKALLYYNKSLKLIDEIGENRERPIVYKLISETYEAKKDYKNSYLYYKRYSKVKDSVFNSEKFKLIEEITAKYNFEKTEQKNMLLEKENQLKKEELNKLNFKQKMYFFISILLAIIIVGLGFLSYKLKQKKTTISKQKETISLQFGLIQQKNTELEKYQNHLEKLVKAKTKKLYIALEKAKESDKLKTAFLNNIFHEVRTPMNAISGFSELLNMKANEKQKIYLSNIIKNINELSSLIDDIIELSKVQAEQQNAENSKISTVDFIFNLKNFAEERCNFYEKTKIYLNFEELTTDIPKYFISDPQKLSKIVKNLLDNAIKYTDEGAINFSCSLESNKIKFAIEDFGIGIEKEKLKHIFDIFIKIEEKDVLYRGAGIGLAIVREYTKILNGEIKVQSEFGKGSKFELLIPLTSLG